MKFTVPVYVERHSQGAGLDPVHFVRPLWFEGPLAEHEHLGAALHKLEDRLVAALEPLSHAWRHDALADYAFNPPLESERIDLRLELKTQTPDCRFLLVTFRLLDRRIGMTPTLPDLWFEIQRGENPQDRAREALTEYFRQLEKDDPELASLPRTLSIPGRAWVEYIDLYLSGARPELDADSSDKFSLAGSSNFSGGTELKRVGRCLDRDVIEDQTALVGRAREVDELLRLLDHHDRRPVLLLGPRLVGKTALVRECVARRVARRGGLSTSQDLVWHVSPQRLISGMSYVGQWESRLLAILRFVAHEHHYLYFDDLVGLFQAGISRDSQLNVAQVLKPFVERREVRLLAEITPEAWRIFQEQDRSFADLFQILPVPVSQSDDTLRILIGIARQLELTRRVRYSLDVIPTIVEITSRYQRDAAFPGKGVNWLQQLAVKQAGNEITRDHVLSAFEGQSGLTMAFLDPRKKLDRHDITAALRKKLLGQPGVVEAVTDVLCVTKARLNALDRPLAAFLFLGPTGVGKTHCAKVLAEYLFGDPERLIRFDMNEFVSPNSVARLVGTLREPEGLLTSAIRRQPFAVLLLDEIEKAHRDVFDLLLQVLGEGRLTDALGRTADFSQALVILTSNLGAREAGSELGFISGEQDRSAIFEQAARKFFRPEFFNRLDRILPFAPLNREEIGGIAQQLMEEVFNREGLLRRKCILRVEERALERVIEQGFHPKLGARALKRAVERELTQPVSLRLAALRPETPTVIRVLPGQTALGIQVIPLENLPASSEPSILGVVSQALPAAPAAEPVEPAPGRAAHVRPLPTPERIAAVEALIDRIEAQVADLRPREALAAGVISESAERYFACKEQARALRERLRNLEDARRMSQRPDASLFRDPGRIHRPLDKAWLEEGPKRLWKAMQAANDIYDFLAEAWRDAPDSTSDDPLALLAPELAVLALLADGTHTGRQALFYVQPLLPWAADWSSAWATLAHTALSDWNGLETTPLREGPPGSPLGVKTFAVSGLAAAALAPGEHGTHLFALRHGALIPVQVHVELLQESEDRETWIKNFSQRGLDWRAALEAGTAALDQDPFPFAPLRRLYAVEASEGPALNQLAKGTTCDWQTGQLARGPLTPQEWRNWLLAAVPAPGWLRAVCQAPSSMPPLS